MNRLSQFFVVVITITAALSSSVSCAEREGRLRKLLGGGVSEPGLKKEQIYHENRLRTFYLYAPSYGLNTPRPLVLALHGTFGNGKRFAEQSQLNKWAGEKGFIVVYPDSVGRQWADGRWVNDQSADVNDVSFISALIRALQRTHNIDKSRIYATGISSGGIMSLRLACEMSDKIAAVASVVGNLARPYVPHCNPEKAISILILNGVSDPFMPWNGGEVAAGRRGDYGEVISAPETARFWAEHNKCMSRPELANLADVDPTDGTRVRRDYYKSCIKGTEVILLGVEGGGHAWPGSPVGSVSKRSGASSRDIIASKEIMEFFERHSLLP